MPLSIWLLAASALATGSWAAVAPAAATPVVSWPLRRSTSDETSGEGGTACSSCLQIGEEGINTLLNYILNAGVVGSCSTLCSHAGSKSAQTACDLACSVVGIKAFVTLIQKADLDPFYLCEELHACPAGPDDASAVLVGAQAQPPSVKKGEEVEMVLEVNVTRATGVGEFRVEVHGPVSGAHIAQAFPLTSGVQVGDQNFGVKLQIQDTHPPPPTPGQPSKQPVIWHPGTYTFDFTFCQGECGSKHPHSKVFGNTSGTFEVTEARAPSLLV